MRYVVLICTFALLSDIPAFGQETVSIRPNEQFDEWLDGEPKVSGGRRLVGLRIGASPSAAFDPKDVRISLTGTPKTLCGWSVSRDGLYGSTIAFDLQETTAVQALLTPFSRSYSDEIRRYAANDLGILTFGSPDGECLLAGKTLLPVMTGPATSKLSLSVFANSGNRLTTATLHTVSLNTDADPIIGRCTEVEGVNVGFDRVCEIALGEGVGPVQARLSLTFDDGLAPEPENYDVYIPLRNPGPPKS